jgi:hypothetical protein
MSAGNNITRADFASIQPGMQVFTADAEQVGQVDEVLSAGIRVSGSKKSGPRFVPIGAIAEVSESERRIDLNVPTDQLASIEGTA